MDTHPTLFQLVRKVLARDSNLSVLAHCVQIRELECINVCETSLINVIVRNPNLVELKVKGKISSRLFSILPSCLKRLELGSEFSWASFGLFLKNPHMNVLEVRLKGCTPCLESLKPLVKKSQSQKVFIDLSSSPSVSKTFLEHLVSSVKRRRDSGCFVEEFVPEIMLTIVVMDCDQLTGADISQVEKVGGGFVKLLGNPKLVDDSEKAVRDYIRYLCGV
jgi:hypothetical protein